ALAGGWQSPQALAASGTQQPLSFSATATSSPSYMVGAGGYYGNLWGGLI
ncbi:MAG: hypothetical protein HY072_00410, partial [Deltaproteobacteria bacterium]|nr:hypothetical protein [Deltaproteobacteria bacterium]